MTLQEGDFFEGVYQLRKELPMGVSQNAWRWLADDFSGSQKKQVVIDFFSYDYDAKLNWIADIEGLLKIGQSVSSNLRYFVWEKEKEKLLTPLLISELSQPEKEEFVRIIDNLALAPDEMVMPNDTPEYWHTNSKEVLFFYRKQTSPFANQKQNAEIKHFWKKILAPYYAPVVPPEVTKEPVATPATKPAAAWRLGLIAVGITLALSVYFLKPLPDDSGDTSNLTALNRAIEEGISQEKSGNYEQAVRSFEKAVKLPLSDQTQERMDSLGYAYEAYAFMECEKYKSLDSTNLFFIADQYFHYASILTGKTSIRKCE